MGGKKGKDKSKQASSAEAGAAAAAVVYVRAPLPAPAALDGSTVAPLRRYTQQPVPTNTVLPTWDADINATEDWGGSESVNETTGLFEDPEGFPLLVSHLQDKLASWRRPSKYLPTAVITASEAAASPEGQAGERDSAAAAAAGVANAGLVERYPVPLDMETESLAVLEAAEAARRERVAGGAAGANSKAPGGGGKKDAKKAGGGKPAAKGKGGAPAANEDASSSSAEPEMNEEGTEWIPRVLIVNPPKVVEPPVASALPTAKEARSDAEAASAAAAGEGQEQEKQQPPTEAELAEREAAAEEARAAADLALRTHLPESRVLVRGFARHWSAAQQVVIEKLEAEATAKAEVEAAAVAAAEAAAADGDTNAASETADAEQKDDAVEGGEGEGGDAVPLQHPTIAEGAEVGATLASVMRVISAYSTSLSAPAPPSSSTPSSDEGGDNDLAPDAAPSEESKEVADGSPQDRESEPFLWELIYPQNEHGRPIYNPSGKYIVRLWASGAWRRVVIDDRMPCGADGACLLLRSEKMEELWPTLLAKAVCKLYGAVGAHAACPDISLPQPQDDTKSRKKSSHHNTISPDEVVRRGRAMAFIAFAVHSLTGWMPESFPNIQELVQGEAPLLLKSTPQRPYEDPSEIAALKSRADASANRGGSGRKASSHHHKRKHGRRHKHKNRKGSSADENVALTPEELERLAEHAERERLWEGVISAPRSEVVVMCCASHRMNISVRDSAKDESPAQAAAPFLEAVPVLSLGTRDEYTRHSSTVSHAGPVAEAGGAPAPPVIPVTTTKTKAKAPVLQLPRAVDASTMVAPPPAAESDPDKKDADPAAAAADEAKAKELLPPPPLWATLREIERKGAGALVFHTRHSEVPGGRAVMHRQWTELAAVEGGGDGDGEGERTPAVSQWAPGPEPAPLMLVVDARPEVLSPPAEAEAEAPTAVADQSNGEGEGEGDGEGGEGAAGGEPVAAVETKEDAPKQEEEWATPPALTISVLAGFGAAAAEEQAAAAAPVAEAQLRICVTPDVDVSCPGAPQPPVVVTLQEVPLPGQEAVFEADVAEAGRVPLAFRLSTNRPQASSMAIAAGRRRAFRVNVIGGCGSSVVFSCSAPVSLGDSAEIITTNAAAAAAPPADAEQSEDQEQPQPQQLIVSANGEYAPVRAGDWQVLFRRTLTLTPPGDNDDSHQRVNFDLHVSDAAARRFIRLTTIDNDTAEETAHAMLATRALTLARNTSGHTVIATLRSPRQDVPAGSWRLHATSPQALSPLSEVPSGDRCVFGGPYIPNKYALLFRDVVTIAPSSVAVSEGNGAAEDGGEGEEGAGKGIIPPPPLALRLSSPDPAVWLRLRVFDAKTMRVVRDTRGRMAVAVMALTPETVEAEPQTAATEADGGEQSPREPTAGDEGAGDDGQRRYIVQGELDTERWELPNDLVSNKPFYFCQTPAEADPSAGDADAANDGGDADAAEKQRNAGGAVTWKLEVSSGAGVVAEHDTVTLNREATQRAAWEEAQPGRAKKSAKARREYLGANGLLPAPPLGEDGQPVASPEEEEDDEEITEEESALQAARAARREQLAAKKELVLPGPTVKVLSAEDLKNRQEDNAMLLANSDARVERELGTLRQRRKEEQGDLEAQRDVLVAWRTQAVQERLDDWALREAYRANAAETAKARAFLREQAKSAVQAQEDAAAAAAGEAANAKNKKGKKR